MNRRSESQFVARPRKNRKPPCSVCGSRRYRKNGLGFYFCEQGHQLENYVPEEADPLDMHFVRNRRLKQDTLLVNERRALKAMSTVLYGQEAKFHFYQCLQYIIKLQCNALINKFGLPAALETVVQELWVLYLSFCNVSLPADLAEYNTASSGRHDINDTENNNDEEIDKTDEWVDMQHHLNTMGFDNGSTEQDEDRSELIGSEVEEEEEEEGEKGATNNTLPMTLEEQLQQRRKKAMTAGKSHAAMHIDSLTNPTMHHSIAICYLACIQLRCPVMLADLHRWIYDGQLPYLNAYSQLPDEYRLRINRQYRTKWQIIVNPSCSDFHRHIRVMAEMYYSQYSIQFPLPNKPLFIYRYLSELSLPIHLYPVAKYLLEVGQPTLEIQKCIHSSCSVLLVAVMLAAKIRYGLHMWCKPMDDLCPAISLNDWLNKLDKKNSTYLSRPWVECDITQWSDKHSKEYLDYCENVVLGQHAAKELNPKLYGMICDVKNILRIASSTVDKSMPLKEKLQTDAINNEKPNKLKEQIYDNRSSLTSMPPRLYDILQPAEPFWDQRYWHLGYARLLEYCSQFSGLTMDQLNYQVHSMAVKIRDNIAQTANTDDDNYTDLHLLSSNDINE